MDKKKILFLGAIILIVILGIVAINISKKNKTPAEIDELNENILKDVLIEGLSINNQAVITRDEISTYTAIITNTLSETKHISEFIIVFTVDGEEIEATAIKDLDLTPNKEMPISISFENDISKATKVDYKLIKD